MSIQPTLTSLKAIRSKRLDCSGKYPKNVRECTIKLCLLYPYRMGKRPQRDNSSSEVISSENVEIARLFFTNEGTQ